MSETRVDADYPSGSLPRYAVVFRTHFWDAFARRQFARLCARVGHGDVFVLVDETNGRVEGIEHDRVVRLTEQDVLDMGLARAGSGNLLWYNGDYPLYYFARQHPGYAYTLQVEYDVVLNCDVDALIRQVAADDVDFVATGNLGEAADWVWLSSCLDHYPAAEVQNKLICISIFSDKALALLMERRIASSAQRRAGTAAAWPMCEGFVATEMERSGLRCADLSTYGSIEACNWWPPNLEADLDTLEEHAFVHPVLDRRRYVGSVVKYPGGLRGFLNLNSILHQKLRKLPPSLYAKTVLGALWTKSLGKLAGARF